MTQFSTFDLFGPLPLPSGASREFLHQIGLQPEPFQDWVRSIDADDPLAELQQYGLTRELSDKIINTAGDHYGAMLPSQYVVSAVETTLSMALSSR
eukprot:gene19531-26210_t